MRVLLLLACVVGAAALIARHNSSEAFTPAWVATAAVADVAVYPTPAAPEPTMHLTSPTADGDPLVLLVAGTAKDVEKDDAWLPVHLPVRPNGSQGWVRAADVTVSTNDYRILIDLDDRKLTLTHEGEVVFKTAIGVGKDNTPTPGGIYYIDELIQPTEADGLYGPFAYGLSGFSDSPEAANFRGGDGALGIHGTNDPASIGKRTSHGCIRVPNDVISHMATILPLGTPVEIV
jgi:lipoprotein-anchoring transpeptidase ErfK/SrfK